MGKKTAREIRKLWELVSETNNLLRDIYDVLADDEPLDLGAAPRVGRHPGDGETPCGWDRLVFDFDVSNVSPAIVGTRVTAADVAAKLIAGWCPALIAHFYRITEADVAAAHDYSIAEGNLEPQGDTLDVVPDDL